jgi:hypothetical protein
LKRGAFRPGEKRIERLRDAFGEPGREFPRRPAGGGALRIAGSESATASAMAGEFFNAVVKVRAAAAGSPAPRTAQSTMRAMRSPASERTRASSGARSAAGMSSSTSVEIFFE